MPLRGRDLGRDRFLSFCFITTEPTTRVSTSMTARMIASLEAPRLRVCTPAKMGMSFFIGSWFLMRRTWFQFATLLSRAWYASFQREDADIFPHVSWGEKGRFARTSREDKNGDVWLPRMKAKIYECSRENLFLRPRGGNTYTEFPVLLGFYCQRV